MSARSLQRHVDSVVEASRQQWFLRLAALTTAIGAMFATTAAAGRWSALPLIIVPILAAITAMRPDSHAALVLMVVVMWHWLATVEGIDTPWLPITAACLVGHHSVVALMATVPIGGVLPPGTIVRWLRNTGVAAGGGLVMWALVVVLDRRDAPGNLVLTVLALVVVAAAATAIRSASANRLH